MSNVSIFPKITFDENLNANVKMAKSLTIEEYLDLLHHTHDGVSEIGGMLEKITNLESKVAELEAKLKESGVTGGDDVNTLSEKVDNLQTQLTALNSELDTYVDEDLQISDWDATTPEIDSNPV